MTRNYVAELEELVMTLVFGKHSGGYGDGLGLRLLSHLRRREVLQVPSKGLCRFSPLPLTRR